MTLARVACRCPRSWLFTSNDQVLSQSHSVDEFRCVPLVNLECTRASVGEYIAGKARCAVPMRQNSPASWGCVMQARCYSDRIHVHHERPLQTRRDQYCLHGEFSRLGREDAAVTSERTCCIDTAQSTEPPNDRLRSQEQSPRSSYPRASDTFSGTRAQ